MSLVLCLVAGSAFAADDWSALEKRLGDAGLHRGYVKALFSRSQMQFDPTVMSRKMDSLLESRRAREAKKTDTAPHEERKDLYSRFTEKERIAAARSFAAEKCDLLRQVEERHGVDRDILTALLLIETHLGQRVGELRVFVQLASMAASVHPDLFFEEMEHQDLSEDELNWMVARTQKKADWAFKELVALIRYAKRATRDPLLLMGSRYGALGLGQFMPTSAEHYAVDGDADGKIDMYQLSDALHSMANYLAEHGWKPGLSRAAKGKVIHRYNHSEHYVQAVLNVADLVAGSCP